MNKELVEKAISELDDAYILEACGHSAGKMKHFSVRNSHLLKVAVLALAVICAGTASVYAMGKYLYETHYNYEKQWVYVGGEPEDGADGDAVVEEPVYQSMEVSAKEADAGVLEKEVAKSSLGKIYYYRFDSYLKAADYFELDRWLGKDPGQMKTTKVSYVDSSYFQIYSIATVYEMKKGDFMVTEGYSIGNVSEDMGAMEKVLNMSNQREYVNKSGITFSLVDGCLSEEIEGFADANQKITVVMIGYKDDEGGIYYGDLLFTGMKEKEIKKVLDCVTVP